MDHGDTMSLVPITNSKVVIVKQIVVIIVFF